MERNLMHHAIYHRGVVDTSCNLSLSMLWKVEKKIKKCAGLIKFYWPISLLIHHDKLCLTGSV